LGLTAVTFFTVFPLMHVIVVFFATGALVGIGMFAVGVGEGELLKVGEDVGEGVDDCIGVGVGVGVGVGATISTRFVSLMAPI
jgi:hypothetical protein